MLAGVGIWNLEDERDENTEMMKSQNENIDGFVDGLLGRISVNHINNTDIIELSVTATSPFEAAYITNTLGYVYQEENQLESRAEVRKVKDFLSEQLELIQNQLKASEKKYRHLFKNSPFSIVLIDRLGVIVDCNPVFENLLNFKKDELIGKHIEKLTIIDPKHIFMLVEVIKSKLKGEGVNFFELQLYRKDGVMVWGNLQFSLVNVNNQTLIHKNSILYSPQHLHLPP